MTRIALAALAALVTSSIASPAAGQQGMQCAPAASVLATHLGTQYGEALSGSGVANGGGGLIQVYANTESGTWTIAITVPGGLTCILSAGEGWSTETVAAPKPGRES